MSRTLSPEEFGAALAGFQHTAFRLEIQPAYDVSEEADFLARLYAGEQVSPEDVPDLSDWFDMIRKLTGEGKRVERVRVVDEPLTDYQRAEQYCDPWNTAAGEVIRYITRSQARTIGLLPVAGPDDWWLLDSHTLLVMHFSPGGQLVERTLTDDPSAVVKAASLRDLAIHHSTPSAVRSTAA